MNVPVEMLLHSLWTKLVAGMHKTRRSRSHGRPHPTQTCTSSKGGVCLAGGKSVHASNIIQSQGAVYMQGRLLST